MSDSQGLLPVPMAASFMPGLATASAHVSRWTERCGGFASINGRPLSTGFPRRRHWSDGKFIVFMRDLLALECADGKLAWQTPIVSAEGLNPGNFIHGSLAATTIGRSGVDPAGQWRDCPRRRREDHLATGHRRYAGGSVSGRHRQTGFPRIAWELRADHSHASRATDRSTQPHDPDRADRPVGFSCALSAVAPELSIDLRWAGLHGEQCRRVDGH